MKLVPRKVKAPDFLPGETTSTPLRTDRIVAYWLLTLGYTWNVAGGTGIGSVHADAAARWLREFTLRGNGAPLQQARGQFYYLYTLLFLQEVLEQTNPTLLAAATAQADREAVLLLPAIMEHVTPEMRETFGFPGVVEPSMEFKFADAEDLVLGGDGVYSASALTSRLMEYSYDDPAIPNGGYAPLLTYTQRQQVVGSQEKIFELDHLRKNGADGMELRALFVESFSGIQAGGRESVYDNDVVASIKSFEIGGRERYKEEAFDDRRQVNKMDYGLEERLTGIVVLDAAADRKAGKGDLWTQSGRTKGVLTLECEQQGADQNEIIVTSVYTAR